MELLLFLLLFPLLTALLVLIPNNTWRNLVVTVSSITLIVASIYLLIVNFNSPTLYFELHIPNLDSTLFAIELIIGIYIIYVGLKHKKYLVPLLALIQMALIMYFEFYGGVHKVTHNLFLDKFSIIMALIIGVIGSLICIFSIGYMKDYHEHHKELKDKRPFFFFILFLFLSAMFGVVFANNLLWLYLAWEITTLCSFLLIAYPETEEATNNAFLAITLNLLGGVGFASGIVYLGLTAHTIELDKMIGLGQNLVLLPAVLIAFAGITKSAQMPFSAWLLGAMVAPTPVSALLHSSTMVKAGVYIVIKLAPIFQDTIAGLMVALVGAVTFVATSCLAISQSNAKRVLAYSTIANLGLIITCAGVGTYEAVWAAILLVIFHAIAKCLLFLCVGSTEHKIGSRDIESMDALVMSMPKMAILILIGIAGMFIAPFGMLISKWAALRALVESNPILVVLVAYGSGATIFFWTKWMGKIMAVTSPKENKEKDVSFSEFSTLYILGAMTIGICALFPLVSTTLIEPYTREVYNAAVSMEQGNIIIMLTMLALVVLMPLTLIIYRKDIKYTPTYLSGRNIDNARFLGSMGITKELAIKNYYLEEYLGEAKLFKPSVITTIAILILMLAFGVSPL